MDERLTLRYLRESNQEFLSQKETARGLKNLEGVIGKIQFLHKTPPEVKIYRIIDSKTGKEVSICRNYKQICELVKASTMAVGKAVNGGKEVNGYIIRKDKGLKEE